MIKIRVKGKPTQYVSSCAYFKPGERIKVVSAIRAKRGYTYERKRGIDWSIIPQKEKDAGKRRGHIRSKMVTLLHSDYPELYDLLQNKAILIIDEKGDKE